jgi:hypothetical protein
MMEKVIDDTPYRRLWAAVLKNAIAEMEHRGERGGAAHWIFSEKTDEGSMRWICDMLDFDHRKLQALCMTRKGRRKILGKPEIRE